MSANKNTKISEAKLRSVIRRKIKEALQSDDSFLSQVGSSVTSRLGSRRQTLDRILATIDTDRLAKLPNNQKVDLLVALVQKFGISARDFASIKSRVQRMIGVNSAVTEADAPSLPSSLASKGEKLEKTQAYQMLMKSIATKPAAQQVDFAIQFLNNLPLDDAGKQRLKMKIRQFM
jgi:hypothetical protein